MCGIAGYRIKYRVDEKVLSRMLGAMYNRGPDSSGYFHSGDYQAGMRRLSINDLKTGDQPLFNTDRSVALLYNGEIYNYPVLRRELENEGFQFEAANASFDLLVKKIMGTYKSTFELIKYYVTVERRPEGDMVNEATVKLNVDGKVEHVVGEGDGPINALDAALRKSLEIFYPAIKDVHLIDYKVRVVNARAGTAARVRVVIESRDKTEIWGTVGCSENIIDASWQALSDSVEYKLQKEIVSPPA